MTDDEIIEKMAILYAAQYIAERNGFTVVPVVTDVKYDHETRTINAKASFNLVPIPTTEGAAL